MGLGLGSGFGPAGCAARPRDLPPMHFGRTSAGRQLASCRLVRVRVGVGVGVGVRVGVRVSVRVRVKVRVRARVS